MIPKFLEKNDKIYLVAPSFGCVMPPYDIRLNKAIDNLKNMGFNLILGPNIFKGEGLISSNSPKLRAKEIMDAFKSDATAVISVGGGELMCEILEYIDFNIIKENPKWFMGFSDNTNLVYTITINTDIETIYGINAPNFFHEKLEYDSLDSLRMLMGEKNFMGYKKWTLNSSNKPLYDYTFDKKTRMLNYNFKSYKGRIIGGCLDCLINLCGTKVDKTKEYIKRHKNEGIIFFFEACDLNSVSLIRAINQLKLAGWFIDVDAFIVGRSLNYFDKSFNITMNEAYYYALKDLNKPMLLNCDLGHLGPSLPIRCGALATVEYKNNNLYITYEE